MPSINPVNPVNEITKVTDDKGHTTTVSYNKAGQRTSIDNPDTGRTDYRYDRAGNLITKTTARLREQGKAIKYVYWFNRLERTLYPDMPDVTYTYGDPGSVYNRAGRVIAVNNGVVKDEFRYGRLGETTWKKRTVGGASYVLQYAYDSMGRQRRLIYPDGEILTYLYDAGGLVYKVIGRTGSETYQYVKNILYNRHGSRTKVEYGNGVSTSYSYDPKMHRLTAVQTKMGARTLQQLSYSYDRVGNITERKDTGFTTTGEETKTVTHTYQYDDLHRLTDAEGTYKAQGSLLDDTLHTYENSFSYDTIGNIMQKVQQHEGPNESGDLATMPGTTYTYNYGYNQARPHAVTSINDGSITFRYDASGNMTARYDEEENSWRTLHWDAENRLVKTIDNEVATNYAYDAEGTRVTKSGSSGEVTYVDPAYVIRNNFITGKHVFVGNTRVASKMDVTGNLTDDEDENVEGVYYYHADHLGSSSMVTGKEGGFHERIEYFPYGETWVEDKATSDGYSSPYRYTAKEYDPETGLYYFGARYYDARLSRWLSTDPALQDGEYFPKPYDFDTEHDFYWYLEQDTSKKFPGIGGVFNAVNLDVYHFGGNNPVKLVDPDGNALILGGAMGLLSGIGTEVAFQAAENLINGNEALDDLDYSDIVISAIAGSGAGAAGVGTIAQGKKAHSAYKKYKTARAALNARKAAMAKKIHRNPKKNAEVASKVKAHGKEMKNAVLKAGVVVTTKKAIQKSANAVESSVKKNSEKDFYISPLARHKGN